VIGLPILLSAQGTSAADIIFDGIRVENYFVLAAVVDIVYQFRTKVLPMELRHLRYFVTVAEDLSFRRAAERLHLSHPTLSKQIADLENELGLKLFNRDPRRVELTEVGRGFLVEARRTLVSAQQAIAHAHEVATGERGRLSIGTMTPLTNAFFPDALARFRELFPLVEVTVLHMTNRAQVDALLNGSIMLGIGYSGLSLDESLTTKPLLRSANCIVCSKHRWPAKRGTPKLSDFRDDNFLTFSPEIDDYDHRIRTVCRLDGGFEPKLLAVGNTFDSLISMVSAGRGVHLCPEIVRRDGTPAINFHVLQESKNQYEMQVVRTKDSETVATVNNFVGILLETVRCLPGKERETHDK
jgi:DNA-binding transcriptional LysR family regulator